MGLSKKAIEEFIKIYSEEKGEEISEEKAKELGENLLEIFKIIYRPVPVKEEKGREKEDKNTCRS